MRKQTKYHVIHSDFAVNFTPTGYIVRFYKRNGKRNEIKRHGQGFCNETKRETTRFRFVTKVSRNFRFALSEISTLEIFDKKNLSSTQVSSMYAILHIHPEVMTVARTWMFTCER